MTHIVVLGAGYTGMMTALAVARRSDAQVTLVNPTDRFVERLRLHQVAAGQKLAEYSIPALLGGSGVAFVQGRANALSAGSVDIGDRELPYDKLVFAIGSAADTSLVPGAASHAYTLDNPSLPAVLADMRGTFVVCGAGLTGVEAATEIAESYPDLHVVLIGRAEPGSMMGAPARAYLRQALDRLGVEVRSGVTITKVLPDGVQLDGHEIVACDGALWTTGVRVPPLASDAGLETDASGRIVVDSALRSVSHPSIYAVGDAAAIKQPYGIMHGTCQSGLPSGAHAADSIVRELAGKQPHPFRFGYLHQPVSLGRHDAVIQFTKPDDTPRRWYLRGRAAVFYKETVSSSPIPTYKFARRFRIPAGLLAPSKGPRR